jgi:exodeoxyribonuclease VII small subunit
MSSQSEPSDAAPPAFEQSLAQLEQLVGQLESGDLPLDAALRTFEQGVRLTRECQVALSAAQQKVQLLMQRDGSAVITDFDVASTSDSAATE